MKRGLTMVELLLALSLLAVLMVAVASWTRIAAQASAKAAQPTRWRTAAERTLELIQADLLIGDFEDDPRTPRIEVASGQLKIRTRQVSADGFGGSVTHRYVFNTPDHELRLEERASGGRQHSRLLLNDVSDWQCMIEEEEQILSVTITARDGREHARRYALP